MMRIGIFGLPNSGKSQFRRWLVRKLREAGLKAEHWDADRFKKSRVPEDNDMCESHEPMDIVWLIEDVRGTVPHKEVKNPGEKEGAWKPLSFYDFIFYLLPDWPTYATFWVSRALQWRKMGAGNWMRESGWENLEDEEVILLKVQHFLNGREDWAKEDKKILSCMPHLFIQPIYTKNQFGWQNFDLDKFIAMVLLPR